MVKLEVGKRYQLRCGRTVTCREYVVNGTSFPYRSYADDNNEQFSHTEIGSFWESGRGSDHDIISEVKEPKIIHHHDANNKTVKFSGYVSSAYNRDEKNMTTALTPEQQHNNKCDDDMLTLTQIQKLQADNRIYREKERPFDGNFIVGEEYITGDGGKFTYMGHNPNHPLGLCYNFYNEAGQVARFEASGRSELKNDHMDIIRHVGPKHKKTFWVNIYKGDSDYGACMHYKKERADLGRGSNSIACIPVTIEFEEGEGL